MGIHELLATNAIDVRALADFLDQLDAPSRLREVRSLSRAEQARLFEASAGAHPISLAHFVPAGTPPLQAVVHYGRNSLPAFHDFEKRFCLPDTRQDELWGYNEQPLKTLTGPGYFVARQANQQEVEIDYTAIPPTKLADWPPILSNSARLSRFLYYRTRDIVRGVSAHVAIGRVTREGRFLDAWFVLCRAGV